ncbi:MAG: succinate dehydrogenase cytochrome b subunit [Thermoflexibacteraceae bacterium]
MDWIIATFRSTIGRKVIMALTGLFLCTFLVVHLAGNLQLLKADDGQAFNIYAQFMTSNPLIKFISYGNYAIILLHVFDALALSMYNKNARPVQYGYQQPTSGTTWSSRNMGILGTIILIFLIVHLKNFWYEMHFGSLEFATYDGKEYKDLYKVVKFAFSGSDYSALYVGFYTLSMLALGFHLVHGFASGFQTLGLYHGKYTPLIKNVGYAFAVVVPALYILIPVYMFVVR